jgi:beta-alanine--pyruvate transaminase
VNINQSSRNWKIGLDELWMPFTSNRRFKSEPRMFAEASGMFYRTNDGREILDGTAGLWAVNAGHCREPIVTAIAKAAAVMDYAPPFQFAHPAAFELATRLAGMMPHGLDRIFFTNSGSEAVESALKIALAYHRARGDSGRIRLIGRARGYHGVNFGGMSVGGILGNRRAFGQMLPHVDHLSHTYDRHRMAFSKGQPEWGLHLADELDQLCALHGGENIAAVIVEPVACSAGVLVPPPGYLERLREITSAQGILLIFDEVITAFGRLGAATAAQRFGVTPDLITMAKALTNAAVPMGAVAVSRDIHDAFMTGPDHMIEFAHGYTYSSHPLACAAGLATLALMEDEGLFARAGRLESMWEDALHSLAGRRHVIDIRNIGLVGAVELEPRPGEPTTRGMDVVRACYDAGLLVRATGDSIALSPPLIIEEEQVARAVEILGATIDTVH